MAVRTRIEPIDRSIVLAIRQGESPEEYSRHLASYARGALKEAQETNRQVVGRVPPHETWVDGRKDAPLESVKPDGVIVFEFELLNDLFAWIGQMLVQNSPVLTGRYSDSFVFFAGGVEVAPGGEVPPAEEYVFLNIQPYARKIERGLSPQAPDGVFQGVAALAKRRFGNMAHIRFSYRSFQEGGITAYIGTGTKRGRNHIASGRHKGRFTATPTDNSAARKAERDTRMPAIVIALR